MHALLILLRSISVVSAGILVGGIVIELVAVIPLLRELGVVDGTRALRIATPKALRTQPPSAIVASVTAVSVLVAWHWTTIPGWRVGLTAAGAALLLFAAAVSLGLYLPTDARIRALDPIPANTAEFDRLIDVMDRWNTVRLAANLVALVCLVEAALQ